MNLFDQLVLQAMKNKAELAPLLVVVEKELLHHDIIREMSAAGLLDSLTFIGGTCLRACYGSNRLSEDLEFTGGKNFNRATLSDLASILVDRLEAKYGLHVTVGEPKKDTGNVDTWKMSIVTRPEQKSLPSQRINIDICTLPSHDRRPMMLRNHYGVEMGTSGLIIQAQSREEILADKLVALALRASRLKNRDLWDIVWLKQQGVDLPLALIPKKILDRHRSTAEFLDLLNERKSKLQMDAVLRTDFIQEMRRFLPAHIVVETIEKEAFWSYLTSVVCAECEQVAQSLGNVSEPPRFKM
ncbi:MAG: nucleotidyl transferase AbiEii/AbiGii toxin family protein [Proteobacteria bacterium]|nr:nucleotidyl transferase AbiEii/AbiGii toxin family protein [Desulfocapsa sp.]MBU3945169.1 nucleotidyl transferase AbiEii/AbiGii toxin family protein [Pseudomonadota bacterium]MCG2745801.1 nucleotidyl transferase AbiEii/AbiGii toxin family protein [Desulfobacteraceae bacterium]MBU3984425.1 nucleotidyl transferase AbiEii/AbiGii toxin family protein [Pseudomonadota bacterium]MBU4028023.1 nucleotidyl transferase AbiEii/AbiGii toxin family protein [Pseudomonadota bacterium]